MATSRSLNKVMIIGNLSRDPVVKTTSSGATVCTFGVATNTAWRDESGELQERTEFHNIVAWNKLAEICAQILAVGMLVYIGGEIRTRTWDDENGVRHYRTEIRVADMKLLDSKGKRGVGLEEARVGMDGEGDKVAIKDSRGEEDKEGDTKDKEKEKKEKQEDNKSKKKEESSEEEVPPEDLPF